MNSTNDNHSTPPGNPTTTTADGEAGTEAGAEAVLRAEAGTGGWEDAVRLQRWAAPNHADFYALGCEMVATLHALEDLTRVLGRQVAGYTAAQRARGRQVYDDTRQIDPRYRLAEAGADLGVLGDRLRSAERAANSFWSAVGHIGTEDVTEDTDPDVDIQDGAGDAGVRS